MKKTTVYIALLRAVNVGGTGKLPMSDLKRLCEEIGFENVRTYIASGNVIFRSGHEERRVVALLEDSLAAYAGRRIGVLVRTAEEMARVLSENPFPDAHPSRTVAIFLDGQPAADALSQVTGLDAEELVLGRREIYVQYRRGIGRSKLRIPAAKDGTARSVNTIAKLTQIAADEP